MQWIELRKDELRAAICPEKGGLLAQLSLEGQDFLYLDEENLRSRERPRCGVPFLVPMFGRLQDSRYTWAGNTYPMDIHGFGHTSPWSVVSRSEDEVVLLLESGPETKRQYPFDFRVTLTYRLEFSQLHIGLRIENTGTEPMPYNYGFHPYFLTDRPEAVEVEARAEAKVDFSSGNMLPFGHDVVKLRIPQGAPEAGAALAGLKSPTCIYVTGENRMLTMAQDESFTQLIFWAQAGKPFLCVEPINGSPNGLNTGNYLTLNPGEVKEAFLNLRPRTH